MKTILNSTIDPSVNFVQTFEDGLVEARYVRRHADYWVCYISSANACSRGCRFCHLTQTKQTKVTDCTIDSMVDQAKETFDHYLTQPKATTVHFNFMARGEFLANSYVEKNSFELFARLGELALTHQLRPKFNVSTIMPDLGHPYQLVDLFPIITPTIYYSIYSLDEGFRRRWMPNALSVDDALEQLTIYQHTSKKIIKLHCSFIKGQNDDLENDIIPMMERVRKSKLRCEFNIVRYNAFDQNSEETENLQMIHYCIAKYMPVKLIDRVGEDVAASCGMFV